MNFRGGGASKNKLLRGNTKGFTFALKNILPAFLQKKLAFTLAEVLITLGIIGIVAAMTLPTLIGNYQKKVLVNQLKKSVSTFEQGMQKIYVSEGAVSWDELGWGLTSDSVLSHGTDFMFQKFKENFNIVSYKIGTEREDLEYIKKMDSQDSVTDISWGGFFILGFTIKLADGSIWYYQGSTDSYKNSFKVILDVNGEKGPNQAGRDVFMLVYTPKGRIAGMFSRNYVRDISDADFSEEDSNAFASIFPCQKNAELNNSGLCFQKIQDDGWEMNY